MAPDGDLIHPRAEPISEEIKYRLFNLEIAEADVHVCEGGNMTRLQSAGLDLEMCTLHLDEETLGLSWQLQSLTVTGFVPNPQEPALQLQVGLVNLGNLHGNLALREPSNCVTTRQLDFLRRADDRTRRLWFLWNADDAVCGCCGGCLFMNGDIARKDVVTCSESAVYTAQFSSLAAFPRHLGMPGLNHALHGSSIFDVECMWSLHKGLLHHYQARYADSALLLHAPTPSLHASSPIHQQQDERSSKNQSGSEEAFVSARSSLTSLLAEEYKSVHEINLEAVEEGLSRKTRHKKKPSTLSVDMRVGDEDVPDLPSGYQGLVATHSLHTVTLQIPYFSKHTASDDHTPTADSAVPRYRVHHRHSVSDVSFMVKETPDTSACSSDQFHLCVPCLSLDSAGTLPLVMQKPATHTLERKRLQHFKRATSGTEPSTDLAKFSLFVKMNGSTSVLLSPAFLPIITR